MIKLWILALCSFAWSLSALAQSTTSLVSLQGNQFYLTTSDQNKDLIVFLHGGVKNPQFQQKRDDIPLNFLIEENQTFLNQCLVNGFDLIAPITNKNLNWLEKPQQTYESLIAFIDSLPKTYQQIYLTGFSDGGTGSFKIFYQNPEAFNGVVVFNGYPQHANFHQTVDHSQVTSKKVVFMGTNKDQTIPYEFLMTAYCDQKKHNSDTYLYLTDGIHSFSSYQQNDFNELFELLTNKANNQKQEMIHGFVKNDELIAFYPYRKKIVKKYGFGKEVYEANKKQLAKYKK